MLRFITLACVCAILVSTSGCSRPSAKILGKWQSLTAENRNAYEFFNDGSAMVRDGSTALSGTWKFIDDGRLKVETTVGGSVVTETYDVTFDSDTVIFKDSLGQVWRFNKVKEFKEFESPAVQAVKKMQAEVFKQGARPDAAKLTELRQAEEQLTPTERGKVGRSGREQFEQRMDKTVEEFSLFLRISKPPFSTSGLTRWRNGERRGRRTVVSGAELHLRAVTRRATRAPVLRGNLARFPNRNRAGNRRTMLRPSSRQDGRHSWRP